MGYENNFERTFKSVYFNNFRLPKRVEGSTEILSIMGAENVEKNAQTEGRSLGI